MRGLFEECGLTKNEAQLYLAMLALGSSTTGPLIKKTGFQSSVVYHLVGRLVEKGVATYVLKGKKKYYSATDPENLTHLLCEKEDQIKKAREALKESMPELREMQRCAKKEDVAQVYYGGKGIRTVSNDALSNAKEILIFGGIGNFSKVLPHYKKFFQQERIRKKIKQRTLLYETPKKNDKPFEKTRYLDPKHNVPFNFLVYKDKVCFNLYEGEPVAILLKNKSLNKAFTQLFNQLWETADQ
ncbi:hypothetical protein GOV11_02445 [Candidatus Woesearchaeota archaeon]|nr:hypothetical protein [Candidatus Woesearchaeota archaeon]